MITNFQLVLAGTFVAGAVAIWIMTGTSKPPKTPRGRLWEFCWRTTLLAVCILAIGSFWPWRTPGPGGWMLVVPLAIGLLALLLRRLPTWIIAAVLIPLGFYGFVMARDGGFWIAPAMVSAVQQYGPLHFGNYSMQYYLVLPLAYALLLLGGWLLWRGLNFRSPITRLVLGPVADQASRTLLWSLLLFPVVFMAAALLSPNLWFGAGAAAAVWTTALLAGTTMLIRRSPRLSAGVATGGLILLGVVGLFVTSTWGHRLGLPETPNQYELYGPIAVSSQTMASAARVQGLIFIGFGLWLAPRTIPQVHQLLGWASDGELIKRVQRLTESRAAAVDTAAADLRRLERNLHDGAQARLVALGMNLRAVERLIPTSPEAALALVAEARETSARALTELRELVRGVHPPVLADRGLGDAIRALALDTPMNVEADIDLPGRLADPVETACYFAAAEILTNAVKHSGARDARVAVSHADGLLRVAITDFGVGGADPACGTGLAGVEKRLATFDGILAVSSPVGGPTMVVMEVPCALSSQKISSC
jgi:signal transduction histidine kinase